MRTTIIIVSLCLIGIIISCNNNSTVSTMKRDIPTEEVQEETPSAVPVAAVENTKNPMREKNVEERPACNICKKNTEVVPIIYGRPSAELAKRSEADEVYLAGCIMPEKPTYWYCKRDENRFGE